MLSYGTCSLTNYALSSSLISDEVISQEYNANTVGSNLFFMLLTARYTETHLRSTRTKQDDTSFIDYGLLQIPKGYEVHEDIKFNIV